MANTKITTIEIKVSRKLLAFFTCIAAALFLLAVILKILILAIAGLILLVNIILEYFKKITITEDKRAVYSAIFIKRNIRFVESLHCTGFLVFNCVKVNGSGASEIKLFGVESYSQVVQFAEKV